MSLPHEETASSPPAPGRKKKVSPARNVAGGILLACLALVAFKEWDANRRSGAAIERLNRALEREDGDFLSMEQVEALIGRAPDGPGVAEEREMKVQ